MDLNNIICHDSEDVARDECQEQRVVVARNVLGATPCSNSMKCTSSLSSQRLQVTASKQQLRHHKRMQHIRKRNAMYSKRKYYKKKQFIDNLTVTKFHLLTKNQELRTSNGELEVAIQKVHDLIALRKTMQSKPVQPPRTVLPLSRPPYRASVGLPPVPASRFAPSTMTMLDPPSSSLSQLFYSTTGTTSHSNGSRLWSPTTHPELWLRTHQTSSSAVAGLPSTTLPTTASSSPFSSWNPDPPTLMSQLLEQQIAANNQLLLLQHDLLIRNDSSIADRSDGMFHRIAASIANNSTIGKGTSFIVPQQLQGSINSRVVPKYQFPMENDHTDRTPPHRQLLKALLLRQLQSMSQN